jgi:hypothetical protein
MFGSGVWTYYGIQSIGVRLRSEIRDPAQNLLEDFFLTMFT